MISNDKRIITFTLPDGLTLGGVTVWSVEMARRLVGLGRAAALIEHPVYSGPKLNLNLPAPVQRVDCTRVVHANSFLLTGRDILEDYLPRYRQVLPGIIVPNGAFGPYAACAAIATHNPEALRVVGFAHTDEPDYYEWLVYYESIIHRFVAVSQEIANTLGRLLPHRISDIIVRPYAVEAPPILMRNYSVPGEPLRLLYAGRMLERQKRVFDLVELVKILADEGVNFRLRLVGDGRDKERLYQKIKLLDEVVGRQVEFEDSLPPNCMPATWQSADISILVSEFEGTSISMLEAMAQGCVPVVTQVSGTTAFVQSGVNGFLAPVGNMAEMARFIKQLDRDRANLVKMGHKAHATIADQLSYEDYVHWFLEVVDEVWTMESRPWPTGRPFLPPDFGRIKSADVLNALRGNRTEFKTLLFKLAAKPGLRWLYRYRKLGRQMLG